jgi:uncharacterized protein (TIGR04255 family)
LEQLRKIGLRKKLTKKPLREAVLEFRWGEPSPQFAGNISQFPGQFMPGAFSDPQHALFFSRMVDQFSSSDYPFHEQLPSANLPSQYTGHVVQHRLRKSAGAWPLVQIGNGVLTVNSTDDYDWDGDYFKRCCNAIKVIYDKYPTDFEKVSKQLISLKYVDAYDLGGANILDVLKRKFTLSLELPERLLQTAKLNTSNPVMFVAEYAYGIMSPRGIIRFRIGQGQDASTPTVKSLLVWETEVQSSGADIPQTLKASVEWLTAAHDVTAAWFWKLIEGELEKEFA